MAHLLLSDATMTTRPLPSRNTGGAVVALAGVTALAGLWRWAQLVQYSARRRDAGGRRRAVPAARVTRTRRGAGRRRQHGVGTGATTPGESIAGLLGRRVSARLHRQSCASTALATLDVIMQLARHRPGRYDLVLIHAGGNDVLRRTPLRVRSRRRWTRSCASRASSPPT
jgi:hypothetical protein